MTGHELTISVASTVNEFAIYCQAIALYIQHAAVRFGQFMHVLLCKATPLQLSASIYVVTRNISSPSLIQRPF